jgi:hypothetical protein
MRFLCLLWICCSASAQSPVINSPPARVSVSLGASATFRVTAGSSTPVAFQWRKNGEPIPNATNINLTITNIVIADAGLYSVEVSNASGSVLSRDAELEVDPTFAKITSGSIVSDGGDSTSAAWIDYDNDRDLDLFVSNFSTAKNFLYANNGDGTFTRVTTGSLANDHLPCEASVWADYDNDGDLDLFVSTFGNDFLFRNDSGGNFVRLATGPVVTSGGSSRGAAWADYDNDGFVDLFVANEQGQKNFLFHNNGDGTFARVTTGRIVNDSGYSTGCSWADFDNDGDLDLFVSNRGQAGFFYRNDGSLGFTRITTGAIASANGGSHGAAWGDYDNDGNPDLFVANYAQKSFLFHNNGDGTFARITNGPIVNDIGNSWGCAWGDFDNDGWLDLFVCNGSTPGASGNNDFLYHNNGDGTFQKITSGSLVNDAEIGDACGWGDFNKDGFLDLFVANFNGQNNRLYRNTGNANHWLMVKCTGRISNRAAIGTRIQVTATVANRRLVQIREISGGGGYNSQTLDAHFGLGDASTIEEILVRWPSGITQRLQVQAIDQFLEIREPPRLSVPAFFNGELSVGLETDPSPHFQMETSSDLQHWTPVEGALSKGAIMRPITRPMEFLRVREL